MLQRSGGTRAGIAACAAALAATTAGCSPPAASEGTSTASQDSDKPNILMVLIDDMGYSDLGVYGGDAATPNIDALARDGLQFTNYHAYPVCAPTRAALITGQDPHRVGLGSTEGLTPPGVPTTTPGYSGALEGTSFTSIAQLLSDTDYLTYQVGKWHLGNGPDQAPQALGFQQNFTMYDGAASHYADMLRVAPRHTAPVDTAPYERSGQPVEVLPQDFYSTHAYTDEMIGMIDRQKDSGKPFFDYLAYTAVHDPLHVPDQRLVAHYLERYLGHNDFKALRTEHIERLARSGLSDPDVEIRWLAQTPDWEALNADQRRDLAYRLAVYAAMIDDLDSQLGRLVSYLRDIGEYDNTLMVVASDNGPSGMPREIYTSAPGAAEWQDENYPLAGIPENYGAPGTFPTLGQPNAQVSSGPYFNIKSSVFEGGTRVPLIVKTPTRQGHATAPRRIDTFTQVTDLYPTFADYAGADVADSSALLGDSAKPLFEGADTRVGDDEFGSELFGQRAYREAQWKLVYAPTQLGGTGSYALYDLRSDPGETRDVATAHPDVTQRLAAKWDRYAAENGVVPVPFDIANAEATQ